MVFTLRPGAKFWDGHPVTPADVVYSLDRNTDPKLGGFYGPVFSRVSSIAATGSDQVTIALKQPDYWLEGELASMPCPARCRAVSGSGSRLPGRWRPSPPS